MSAGCEIRIYDKDGWITNLDISKDGKVIFHTDTQRGLESQMAGVSLVQFIKELVNQKPTQ